MNDVDLRAEIKAYIADVVKDIGGEMGEMVRSVALREGGLLRPQIAIRSAEVYGVPRKHIMPAAAGLELVHGATLILDDTPLMDDSDTRNGAPSFHKMYGADRAILVAQYLTASLAPQLNAQNSYLTAEQRSGIQSESARAAEGLCVGQNDDLHHRPEGLDEVIRLHRRKTGDLFAAAALVGGIAGNATDMELNKLRSFGYHLGIAYQMGDDLYDVLGDPKKGGKPIGQDKDKVTVLNFKDEVGAVRLWKAFYEKAEADLLELSGWLRARERAGEFAGKADVEPLQKVLSLVRDRQMSTLEDSVV